VLRCTIMLADAINEFETLTGMHALLLKDGQDARATPTFLPVQLTPVTAILRPAQSALPHQTLHVL
jgi:hypothetical protein